MNKKKSILLILCPPVWEKLPPLGPAYISEYLIERGHRVFYYDLNLKINRSLDNLFQKDWTINRDYITGEFYNNCLRQFPAFFLEILSLIAKEGIEFIGFTVFKGNRIFSLRLSGFIKSEFPQTRIIFGGPETFSIEQEGFSGFELIDFVVIGEGEEAVLSILDNRNPERIMRFLKPGDINFFPKFSNMDISSYPGKERLPVLASRGCFNGCRFCSEKLLYPSYRMRTPVNILEEIEHHIRNFNVKSFIFYDSLFNGNPEILNKLLDMILERGINISWEAQIAIRRDMPAELMIKMKRSGCVNLFIGLESGSDKILKIMDKPFESLGAAKFLEMLVSAGLSFEISLIVNYPGETEKEFLETMDFISKYRHLIKKIAQISIFRKYPGTGVSVPEDYSVEKGYEKIKRLTELLDKLSIRYTPSYVNNLI